MNRQPGSLSQQVTADMGAIGYARVIRIFLEPKLVPIFLSDTVLNMVFVADAFGKHFASMICSSSPPAQAELDIRKSKVLTRGRPDSVPSENSHHQTQSRILRTSVQYVNRFNWQTKSIYISTCCFTEGQSR